ncbi:MAG: hypothetical protein ABIR29_05755, partial [Chthoniobacterales bacterium]
MLIAGVCEWSGACPGFVYGTVDFGAGQFCVAIPTSGYQYLSVSKDTACLPAARLQEAAGGLEDNGAGQTHLDQADEQKKTRKGATFRRTLPEIPVERLATEAGECLFGGYRFREPPFVIPFDFTLIARCYLVSVLNVQIRNRFPWKVLDS